MLLAFFSITTDENRKISGAHGGGLDSGKLS